MHEIIFLENGLMAQIIWTRYNAKNMIVNFRIFNSYWSDEMMETVSRNEYDSPKLFILNNY